MSKLEANPIILDCLQEVKTDFDCAQKVPGNKFGFVLPDWDVCGSLSLIVRIARV